MKKHIFITTALLFFGVMLYQNSAEAQAVFYNNKISVQGYLKQAGVGLNGDYNMQFEVIQNGGASPVWCQTVNSVAITNGIFNQTLSGLSDCSGLTNAMGPAVFSAAANTDYFQLKVLVDVGAGLGAGAATFSGIDFVSTPMALVCNQANTATNAGFLTTAGTAGQFLKYTAGAWSSAGISASDVSGLGTAATSSSGSFLQTSNNLSDVSSASTARTNLGLGTASTLSSAAVLQAANNLSDISNAATARSNLGLGSISTGSSGSFLQTANNLSDLNSATTARTNLGLGAAAVLGTGTATNNVVQYSAANTLPAANGSNLTNVSASTLTTTGNPGQFLKYSGGAWASAQIATTDVSGLGTAATASSSSFMQASNNLSDLNSATTARTNLGLGASALLGTGTATNNVVQYSAANTLPAANGSNLTNVNAATLGGATFASPGAIGSTTASTGAFTTLSATGAITSTLATGTAPFTVASTTAVANLNASLLGGATFASPGAIGSSTAGTGAFTTLTSNSTTTLGGSGVTSKINDTPLAATTTKIGDTPGTGGTSTVNIASSATSTGVSVVTIGSTLNASSLSLNSGTGNMTVNSNTGNMTLTSTGATGISLNASTNGPVNIGTGTTTSAIGIGGTGAQTINIQTGAPTAAQTLNIQTGGTAAQVQTTNIGNTTGTSNAVVIKAGSGVTGGAAAGSISLTGHVASGGGSPTVGGTAGCTLAAGNDTAGRITTTGASTCTVTFKVLYATAPYCIVSPSTGTATISVAPTTSVFSLTTSGSGTFWYICLQ